MFTAGCPPLPLSRLNAVVNQTPLAYPVSVQLTCHYGYWLSAKNTDVQVLSCTKNWSWDPAPTTCTPLQCPSQIAYSNATESSRTGTTVNSTVKYNCMDGYKLKNNRTLAILTCDVSPTDNAKAIWKGDSPLCSPIICDDPEKPSNGSVKVESLTFKSIATYFCDPGYNPVGPSQRTCLANTSWSGSQPTCKGTTLASVSLCSE